MSWVRPSGFAPRCLVIVEDHLHHVTEILAALAAADPGLPAWATVVCLDAPGPDTTAAVRSWLEIYRGLQVASAPGEGGLSAEPAARWQALDPAVFTSASRFCSTVGGLLRPGGLLLQDIQLSTLRFISEERWWESIVLANAVRGQLSDRPPSCLFLSNKRSYAATCWTPASIRGATCCPRTIPTAPSPLSCAASSPVPSPAFCASRASRTPFRSPTTKGTAARSKPSSTSSSGAAKRRSTSVAGSSPRRTTAPVSPCEPTARRR